MRNRIYKSGMGFTNLSRYLQIPVGTYKSQSVFIHRRLDLQIPITICISEAGFANPHRYLLTPVGIYKFQSVFIIYYIPGWIYKSPLLFVYPSLDLQIPNGIYKSQSIFINSSQNLQIPGWIYNKYQVGFINTVVEYKS